METAPDIVVDLEDRPHGLSAFVETLVSAVVEIDGLCGLYADGVGIDHAETGEFARIVRQLADAEVEVDLVYVASRGRMVLGVDDIHRARTALEDRR
jgi:hypothetical protein